MDNSKPTKMSDGGSLVSRMGYGSLKEMADALDAMSSEDVRNVDPAELLDYKEIRIDESLPVTDRLISLLTQTKNPYFFRYNGMVVKTSFAGKQPIEDCLMECFFRD